MPKTKLQNVIFTIIMAFVMVYAMVCYNIAIDKGGMSNQIFLLAFHEMPIMWPIAAILEFFNVGNKELFIYSMPSFLQNLPYNIEDSWEVVKGDGRKPEL